jgi:tetratricopeptide (TPR) repeat protein
MESRYCSKECQSKHWPLHKIPCKESKTKKQELEAAKEKEKKREEKEAAEIRAVRNPPCAFCGGVSFETCSGCGFVHYCDRDCQKKHWPVHKIPCRDSPIYKANQEVAAAKKTLADQEQALGADHANTAIALSNLAQSLSALQQHDEALPLQRQALAHREKALGPMHPATATSLHSLAQMHLALGQPDLALLGRYRTWAGRS